MHRADDVEGGSAGAVEEQQRVFMPAHVAQLRGLPPATLSIHIGGKDTLKCTRLLRLPSLTAGITHPHAQFAPPNARSMTILTQCQQPQLGVEAQALDARERAA